MSGSDAFTSLNSLPTQRHSCRAFLKRPVARTLVEGVVKTAQKVPSWCNSQPWQFIVLSHAETNRLRDQLMASGAVAVIPDVTFPERYIGTYKTRRSECGW